MVKIISLGGGCSAAANLRDLKMRKKAQFFDYLWNLDDGLKSVEKIVDGNLEGFDSEDFYKRDYHLKWNSNNGKFVKREEVIVSKGYPNIAFIHYDIFKDKDALSSFERKAVRFRKILKSNGEIVFIYYRCYSEPINSDYKKYEDFDIKNKLEYFKKESEDFVSYFTKKYPKRKFKLHSIFTMPIDDHVDVKKKIENFVLALKPSKNLVFSKVHINDDKNPERNKFSIEDWKSALLPYKRISLFEKMRRVIFGTP